MNSMALVCFYPMVYGGAELYMYTIKEAAEKRGDKVTLCCKPSSIPLPDDTYIMNVKDVDGIAKYLNGFDVVNFQGVPFKTDADHWLKVVPKLTTKLVFTWHSHLFTENIKRDEYKKIYNLLNRCDLVIQHDPDVNFGRPSAPLRLPYIAEETPDINLGNRIQRLTLACRPEPWKNREFLFSLYPEAKKRNIILEIMGNQGWTASYWQMKSMRKKMPFELPMCYEKDERFKGSHKTMKSEKTQEFLDIEQTPDLFYVYGHYVPYQARKRLSESTFGCEFISIKYHQHKVLDRGKMNYGNPQYQMMEVMAYSLPIMETHYMDNARIPGETRVMRDLGVGLEAKGTRSRLIGNADELMDNVLSLGSNPVEYRRQREVCLDYLRTYHDSEVVYNDLWSSIYDEDKQVLHPSLI